MHTKKPSHLRLYVGLGNDDPTYFNTYHNVGFLMIDYLEGLSDINVSLEKNSGYMNSVGPDIKKIARKANAKPEELLVIHDDSDLPLGAYKLSFDRGPAGHKGVTSTINSLGTKKFWRLRIGIRPEEKIRSKAGDFVLKKITKANRAILENVFEQAASALKN